MSNQKRAKGSRIKGLDRGVLTIFNLVLFVLVFTIGSVIKILPSTTLISSNDIVIYSFVEFLDCVVSETGREELFSYLIKGVEANAKETKDEKKKPNTKAETENEIAHTLYSQASPHSAHNFSHQTVPKTT